MGCTYALWPRVRIHRAFFFSQVLELGHLCCSSSYFQTHPLSLCILQHIVYTICRHYPHKITDCLLVPLSTHPEHIHSGSCGCCLHVNDPQSVSAARVVLGPKHPGTQAKSIPWTPQVQPVQNQIFSFLNRIVFFFIMVTEASPEPPT